MTNVVELNPNCTKPATLLREALALGDSIDGVMIFIATKDGAAQVSISSMQMRDAAWLLLRGQARVTEMIRENDR